MLYNATMKTYDNYIAEDIRKEISKFKNDESLIKLNSFYQSKSYSEILGVSRKELSHSKFLAWILNPYESHKIGFFGIKKFLDIVVLMSNAKLTEKNKKLYNSIITDDISIEKIIIETEKPIDKYGRLDIYLELSILNSVYNKIKIVVENKVTSKENNDQTNRYFQYFEQNNNEATKIIYVFLTPISTLKLLELEEAECNCKDFIQINYQTLVDKMFEPLLSQDLPEKTKFIFKEYLQSLSQPSIADNRELQEGLIMAIGKEERDLLTQFWKNNEKLILASLYAISSDPEQDKDVRDSINDALDKISNSSKDRSLIDIQYQGKTIVYQIRKSDIGFKTIELLNDKNLITAEALTFLRNDKSSSFNLLKKLDEISENEIKYKKYRTNEPAELILNFEEFYVVRNWGIGNIPKFIKVIEERFPDIKYIIHNS